MAANTLIATVAFTPAIVISRLTRGSRAPFWARLLSTSASSEPRRSSSPAWRRTTRRWFLGERLSFQPALHALRTKHLVRRDQVGVQNRLAPVLKAGQLGDELRSFGHHATACLGLFGPASTLRVEIRSQGASPVPPRRSYRLHLCPGDGPDRIGLAMMTRPTRARASDDRARVPVASMMISSSA